MEVGRARRISRVILLPGIKNVLLQMIVDDESVPHAKQRQRFYRQSTRHHASAGGVIPGCDVDVVAGVVVQRMTPRVEGGVATVRCIGQR